MHLRNRTAAILHDLLLIPVAWALAYWLRFNLGNVPQPYLDVGISSLWFVLPVQAGCFWYYGLYRGVWRFASLPDLIRIIKAVVLGVLVSATVLFVVTRMQDIPRSIFPLYGLLLCVLLGGSRLVYRWVKDKSLYLGQGSRVLVVGAGRAGEMLARELLRSPEQEYRPVAFVDDDRRKLGREIHGIRVLGTSGQIAQVCQDHEIDLILIAIPTASSAQMRAIVEACEQSQVPFRTLPPMKALVSGRAVLEELREVSIEDLLGRLPVVLDWEGIRKSLTGRRILVSGGGGSIGAELCRQLAALNPSELIIYESSEFNLYSIEFELKKHFPNLPLRVVLGDVRDATAVEHLFKTYQPNVVFHAAAYKHVPMLEEQARQAIDNNVLGTRVLAMAADRHAVDAFVLISTDKAVNPANVMGASKRIAEIFCQNLDRRSQTRFITVRFGNVLGSAGSVVPLFREQIRAGGPVTVTHPEMIRYFMTIPEACQLILQAGAMGKGGEIFVLEMGEPVKITYLAEQMIRLSGLEPGKDIKIVYTGLRPGEKLFEELFHEKELSGTGHEKILLAKARPVDWEYLQQRLQRMEEACQVYDEPAIMQLIRELVPEMQAPATAQPDNVIPFEVKSKL